MLLMIYNIWCIIDGFGRNDCRFTMAQLLLNRQYEALWQSINQQYEQRTNVYLFNHNVCICTEKSRITTASNITEQHHVNEHELLHHNGKQGDEQGAHSLRRMPFYLERTRTLTELNETH